MTQDRTLAGFRQVDTHAAPVQLFAGEHQITNDSAPSLAAIVRYQLCAILPTGITPFVSGTHTADQAVIAQIGAAAAGQQVSYWDEGAFNWKAIVLPAGVALDTLAELKAFFNGTNLKFMHLN